MLGLTELPSAARAILTWLTGGSASAALVSVVAAISMLVLGLIFRRYVGILGADRRRPAERSGYDALRNSLSESNRIPHIYRRSLKLMLDQMDRFFGDAGMWQHSLFPHAFGLRQPAPLWTALSFDRCLLIAFIYPFIVIYLIWSISGHVGPAEMALRLRANLSGWERGLLSLLLALAGLLISLLYQGKRTLPKFAIFSIISTSFTILYISLSQPSLIITLAVSIAIAWCFILLVILV